MDQTSSLLNARILLMEPDLDGAARTAAKLMAAGLGVFQVVDPVEALAGLRSERVDLVVMHLPVNEMIGMDLPNVLRSVAQVPYLPVIVLAQTPQEPERCRFMDSGADDVLSDDVSGEEIVARVRALLRIKDLHDQLASSRAALQDSLSRERKLLEKLRRDNAQLQALCITDPLTHVQNVRSFNDILRHEFRMARRYDQPLSLLMLDVDHFKVVNDTHGHPTGDYVLKELAVILKQSVRESDVVARTGGEEFSIVLPKADRRRAALFAQRIRKQVAAHEFVVYDHHIHVTISIGSASYPADAEITEPEMLVYFADQALLTAKETGRDRVVAVHGLGPVVRRRLRRQYLGSCLAAADKAVVAEIEAVEEAVADSRP